MGLRRRKTADVIDISPVVCPGCQSSVEIDDDFCRRCEHNLLEILSSPEPPHQPAPEPATARPRSWWRLALVTSVLLLLTGGAAYAGWMKFVRPSVGTFDADVVAAAAIAEDVQRDQDALQDPSTLAAFAEDLEDASDDLSDVAATTGTIESDKHREAAESVVEALEAYLAELQRLATLPSAEINGSQYTRAEELADDLVSAIGVAATLRDLDSVRGVEASPASLQRVLANLREYREQVLRQRARIIAANKARAQRLARVRAFAGQMDGVVARYTAARGDLSDWIQDVDTYGASFSEAYQVLEEHSERRRQLRSELAALAAPAELAASKESLLAVMDQAVAATEAAYRGIEEYQWDYRYLFYDETPGWRTFESQTSSISDQYGNVLAEYSAQKERVIARLSKKTPLPKVPD